jgi:hypothetical protein
MQMILFYNLIYYKLNFIGNNKISRNKTIYYNIIKHPKFYYIIFLQIERKNQNEKT